MASAQGTIRDDATRASPEELGHLLRYGRVRPAESGSVCAREKSPAAGIQVQRAGSASTYSKYGACLLSDARTAPGGRDECPVLAVSAPVALRRHCRRGASPKRPD